MQEVATARSKIAAHRQRVTELQTELQEQIASMEDQFAQRESRVKQKIDYFSECLRDGNATIQFQKAKLGKQPEEKQVEGELPS